MYKGGLESLRVEHEQLFEAIDKDSRDIKTIHILRTTGEDWYIEQLRVVLHTDTADDWIMVLANQTHSFFNYLSNKINTNCDYEYLFNVCRHWESKDSDWVRLSKALNAFCFQQVAGFMAGENTETQIQAALQNNSISEEQLLDVAKRADVWIPPSLLPEMTAGILTTSIGVADVTDAPTAKFVQGQSDVFSNATLQQHENEEIVFYHELNAFPLFRIGSLADYEKDYSDTTGDELYKRHTDFNLIARLRYIMPPTDEEQIKAINAMGKLLLEALITGCFVDVKNNDNDKSELLFAPPQIGARPLGNIFISQNFHRVAKLFSSSENDQYRCALEEQIDAQKTRLMGGTRDTVFEILSVLNEYRVRIYPTEMRGSLYAQGFMRIVVSGLYRDYHAACADEISQGGEYTDKQLNIMVADRVGKVDLKQVSREFPFRESHAKQDARVLKMPEERN